MKRNTKGFTLIELLAVIVVLAIIALIATPIVLNMIDDAKEGAAKSSAYSYVRAVENSVLTEMLDDTSLNLNGETYTVSEETLTSGDDTLTVTIKGDLPESGSLTFGANGTVTTGNLTINGYTFNYANYEFTKSES